LRCRVAYWTASIAFRPAAAQPASMSPEGAPPTPMPPTSALPNLTGKPPAWMTMRTSMSRKPSLAGFAAMNSARPAVSRPKAAEVNALPCALVTVCGPALSAFSSTLVEPSRATMATLTLGPCATQAVSAASAALAARSSGRYAAVGSSCAAAASGATKAAASTRLRIIVSSFQVDGRKEISSTAAIPVSAGLAAASVVLRSLVPVEPDARHLGRRGRAELGADAGTVAFHRARRQPESFGDLARREASGDAIEDFMLARRQRGEQCLRFRGLGAPGERARQRFLSPLDCVDQVLLVDRLGEEVDRTVAEGAPTGLDVAMAGNDDRRPVDALRDQPLLQLQSGNCRHADVEDEAAGLELRRLGQERLRIGEAGRADADRREQQAEGVAHRLVVIDQIDRMVHGAASAIPSWRGRTTRNVAPGPPSTSVISPPARSTRRWLSARPRPVPSARVVVKGVKRRGRMSAAMPGPSSATSSTVRPSVLRSVTETRPAALPSP